MISTQPNFFPYNVNTANCLGWAIMKKQHHLLILYKLPSTREIPWGAKASLNFTTERHRQKVREAKQMHPGERMPAAANGLLHTSLYTLWCYHSLIFSKRTITNSLSLFWKKHLTSLSFCSQTMHIVQKGFSNHYNTW